MKFLTCFRWDCVLVCDEGRGKRMVTIAFALMLQCACQESHRLLCDGSILVQCLDDHLHGHRRFAYMPHIVVGDMRHRSVADLSFAGEEGFGRSGHANDGHAPGSISIRFRFGGEARSLDRDQGTAAVENTTSCAHSGFQLIREIAAKWIRHAYMGHDSLAEERAGAALRVIVDLVWDDNVAWRKLLL